jgi:hypothetical protein
MVFDGVDDYATITKALSVPFGYSIVFGPTLGVGIIDRLDSANPASSLWALTSTDLYFEHTGGPAYALTRNNVYNSVHATFAAAASAAYINGQLSTPLLSSILTSIPGLIIGQNRLKNTPLSGTVSHLLLYNRALSAKDVRQNHLTYLKPAMSAVGVTLP